MPGAPVARPYMRKKHKLSSNDSGFRRSAPGFRLPGSHLRRPIDGRTTAQRLSALRARLPPTCPRRPRVDTACANFRNTIVIGEPAVAAGCLWGFSAVYAVTVPKCVSMGCSLHPTALDMPSSAWLLHPAQTAVPVNLLCHAACQRLLPVVVPLVALPQAGEGPVAGNIGRAGSAASAHGATLSNSHGG